MEMDWRWNPIEIGFRNQSTRTERNCSRSPIIRPDWWVVVVVSVEVQLREAEHNTAGKWARGQGQSVSHARPPIKSLSWEISLN